jgi:drug/metabolite transporter (DMT)-like permease
MEILLLSIAISSLLFVIFKLFERFRVHNFTAIVINYLVAYGVGVLIEGNWILPEAMTLSWFFPAVGLGVLFISLFTLMAKITQSQGIGISVLANKMSLILPVVLAFFFLNERITLVQLSGIILALAGIYLTATRKDTTLSFYSLKWPLVLFLGSGFLDFGLKLNQQFF